MAEKAGKITTGIVFRGDRIRNLKEKADMGFIRAVAWFMYQKKYFLLQFRQGILIIKMYSQREKRGKRGKDRKAFHVLNPFPGRIGT